MRHTCLWPFLVVICLVAGAASAQSISYVYDERGRLIAVTDPAGDTAVYTYDATGNVLSIARHSSSSLSIIRFTPTSGPIGSTVMIWGTAFSTTPAQDAVTFNGTAATVVSATSTILVVTVPAGATTGQIGVTTPGGSVTSSGSFTVTAATPDVPTITGFSPSLADFGSAATITGTNFQATRVNNKVTFNAGLASADSGSTTTQIATTVPTHGTSGKIRVATPAGEAVSAADFFVPPLPSVASDVTYTNRMALGDTLGVPVNVSGKIALVVFDVALGHRVNVKASGVSGALKVNRPDGSLFASLPVGFLAAYTDPVTVTMGGTYTVIVDPTGTGTGTTTVTLYDVPADVTGTIPTTGANTPVTLSTPGQNAHLIFTGSVSQRVSLKAGAGPAGSVRIGKPDGSALSTGSVSAVPTFIDTVSLPVAGTYTVDVDPTSGNTGSVTLNLYDVPADVTGSITAGGSPVTVTLSTPGQNGALTFTGTAAERISLKISSGPTGSVQIRRSSGPSVASGSMGPVATFIDTTSLPANDTYTIAVDPSSFNTGSVTLTLYDVPADASGTLTINGGAVGVSLTPGQNGSYTFAGTSGQTATVRVTSNTMGSVLVKLLKPDGTLLTSTTSLAGSFNLSQQTLPTSGTYTVVVDPVGANSGSLNLSVTHP